MNDKITAINMIERILFVLNKNQSKNELETIPYTREADIEINPLLKSTINALKIPKENIRSVNTLTDSHEKMNVLYFIVVDKLQGVKCSHFHTKIDKYNYTFLFIDSRIFNFEYNYFAQSIIDIYKIIDIIISSKVLNVSKEDFNVLEMDCLTLLCTYDLSYKTKDFNNNIKHALTPDTVYFKDTIIERMNNWWGESLEEIIAYFDKHGDDPEFLDDIFTKLDYLHFIKDFKLMEFEKWEEKYRYHS